MIQTQSSKLLLPWIEEACDRDQFPGLLYWVDKSIKIFYLSWIHKSSETWNKSNSKVFEEWAAYKRKLGEKDDRDLKAAFRNALRSKKMNLKLIEKGKNCRKWQIIGETVKQQSVTNKVSSNNKVKKAKMKRNTKKVTCKCQKSNPIQIPTKNQSEMIDENSLAPCDMLLHERSEVPEVLISNDFPSSLGEISDRSPLPSYQSLLPASPAVTQTAHSNVFPSLLVENAELCPLQGPEATVAQLPPNCTSSRSSSPFKADTPVRLENYNPSYEADTNKRISSLYPEYSNTPFHDSTLNFLNGGIESSFTEASPYSIWTNQEFSTITSDDISEEYNHENVFNFQFEEDKLCQTLLDFDVNHFIEKSEFALGKEHETIKIDFVDPFLIFV